MVINRRVSKTIKEAFIVSNIRGIHTRPATEIVKCTMNFKSDIQLHYQKHEVNAKSILGILMLAAPKGARITVKATGIDAEEAVAALLSLANNSFNIHY